MAEDIDFQFDFSPYKEYVPYSGDGGSDLLPFDGIVTSKIVKIVPYITKSKIHDGKEVGKKNAVKVYTVVTDEEGWKDAAGVLHTAKGCKLISDVLCSGEDKNNEALGRQLIDLLLSTGTTLEKIHQNAAAGAKMGIKQIGQALTEKACYQRVRAAITNQGKETTDAEFVTPENYTQAKTIGAHRSSRKAVAPATVAAAAQGMNLGGVTTVVGNGAAAATGSIPML